MAGRGFDGQFQPRASSTIECNVHDLGFYAPNSVNGPSIRPKYIFNKSN